MTRAFVLLGIAVGVLVGIGGYTFIYARGASYMTNDPKACANCHVMNEQYDGWVKSSHRSVATCNDCHAPHDLIGKYTTKAINGFNHSFAFTSGRFPEQILDHHAQPARDRGRVPVLPRRHRRGHRSGRACAAGTRRRPTACGATGRWGTDGQG